MIRPAASYTIGITFLGLDAQSTANVSCPSHNLERQNAFDKSGMQLLRRCFLLFQEPNVAARVWPLNQRLGSASARQRQKAGLVVNTL